MSVYTVGRYFTVETPQGLHNALQIKYLHPNTVCMPKRSALAPTTQEDFVDRAIFSLGQCVMCALCLAFSPFRLPSALFHKLTCHLSQEVLPDTLGWVAPRIFPWHLCVGISLDIPQSSGQVFLHFSCTTAKKLAVAT